MPRKTKIKTKVSSYGRNLSLIMTASRFAALAELLPEDSEERIAIEQMIKDATKRKSDDELKARLSQPMSNETLTRFGWTLLSDERNLVNAGIRQGSFRLDGHEQRSGWVFGPEGAFDREAEDKVVLRKGWQAGVFCEKHSAYLLGEPRENEAEARQEAQDMLERWGKEVPITLKRILGMPRTSEEGHPDLPEGAMQYYGNVPSRPSMLAHSVRALDDKPLYKRDNHRRVDVIQFDARLTNANYDILKLPEWSLGAREYNPKWDAHAYIFSGPLDCILGKVWGAVANTNPQSYHGVSESFPYDNKTIAEDAAKAIAIENSFIEEKDFPRPDVMPIPGFSMTVSASDNPFA